MAQHVFILGAGASADAGAPLMANFLDVADDLRRNRMLKLDREAFDLVFDGIHELKRAHSNSVLDVNNIESVLGAFEAAVLFGGPLGSMPEATVAKLPDAMRTVIVETLEERFQFPVVNGSTYAPLSYQNLANLIATLHKRGERCAVLTFNYDLGIDTALERHGFDYHLNSAMLTGPVPLLKLHGSLNWRINTTTKQIKDHRSALQYTQAANHYGNPPEFLPVRFSEFIPRDDGWEHVIVPPTWNKMNHYASIQNVWKTAASELRAAENIFVAGFSLPATDAFFHMLYALGTTGKERIRRFRVYNPDESVGAKFKAILGPSVDERRFKALPIYFEDVADRVGSELRTRA